MVDNSNVEGVCCLYEKHIDNIIKSNSIERLYFKICDHEHLIKITKKNKHYVEWIKKEENKQIVKKYDEWRLALERQSERRNKLIDKSKSDIMKYYKLISDMPPDNPQEHVHNKWYIISENVDTPCAIKLLENIYKLDNKTTKIKWDILSQNTNIFTYEYKTIKK